MRRGGGVRVRAPKVPLKELESRRWLSLRWFAGLLVSLAALAVYAVYTGSQIGKLRELQTEIIDRNRMDSLLLVRIQNNLNTLGLAMRDMLDANEPYPLAAWRSQFQRIRVDLEDAVAREARFAPSIRTEDQARFLAWSMDQFWAALDRVFELAERDEQEARAQIRLSLQARQAALSTAVSRLLVQNNESEQQAAARTAEIYAEVERNLYVFLAAMLALIAAVSVYLVNYNRRVFDQVTALSQRRSELAQQLISIQESTFRSISRELHDEFGQVLTAVGTLLQRAHRKPEAADLREVHEIVQATLEKVRALSQALHPIVLEEAGLESALEGYLATFEHRTGIAVRYLKAGGGCLIPREVGIHVYRVVQEALNNVARHSGCRRAEVRLTLAPQRVRVEIEDEGVGFGSRGKDGLGLVSMRERTDIVGGTIEFVEGARGGALVRLTVPVLVEELHAAGI